MPKKYLFVNFKLLSYVFQFVYYKSGLDKLMLINVTDRQINRQTDKQTDILFTEEKIITHLFVIGMKNIYVHVHT